MSKLYLAGPMSGIKQFNFPLFIRAAAELRKAGHQIVSPAELDKDDNPKMYDAAMASPDGAMGSLAGLQGATWGEVLARDVRIIANDVSGVVFLPGWPASRGARLEATVGVLCKRDFFLYKGDGKLERISADDVYDLVFTNMDTSYDHRRKAI